MGFTTAYSAVTWTAGDVITEAKLDAMVANDQAYDSHSAQGLELDEMTLPSTPATNKIRLYSKDSGGVSDLFYLKDNGNEVQLKGSNPDGWVSADQTWTYASATTINVPSGAASIYKKGDKIRFKQGAGYKYMYIIGVADTLLTLTGGSDYTVANIAITNNYYSHQSNPIGFPICFNFTTNASGFTGALSTNQGYFAINGNLITIFIDIGGTSNATTFTFTPPVTLSGYLLSGWAQDYSVFQSVVPLFEFGATTNIYKTGALGAWSTGGSKRIINTFSLIY